MPSKIIAFLLLCASARASDIASWYVPRTNGLVCATRWYPVGAQLKITEVHNGISVVVTVIERGPNWKYANQRRVDLSLSAFKVIAGPELGLAEVTITRVK